MSDAVNLRIFEVPTATQIDPPGKSPDRFQVMVRVDKSLPAQALAGYANAQGGRIEKTILPASSALADGHGSTFVLSFPDTPARDAIITALSHRPGVEVAELDATVSPMLASTDTHYLSGALWGMLGPTGDGIGPVGNAFGTGADVVWASTAVSADGNVGSMRTVVGVIDTGVDPMHPDLYLNIWINQKEIPAGLATDRDGDGVITFRDLNVKASGVYVNSVTDINANGYIDADDILRDTRWANSVDNDANGYLDDLFGWDFFANDNRPFESYKGGTSGVTEPADSYHGTHVSGTIGALANGVGVVGVNWDVQIMPLRFLGPPGVGGNTSDAVEALYYYTALGLDHPDLNFVGTNNSWGGGAASTLLADAIKSSGDNGHLVIVAAGNSASNNNLVASYPSNYAVTSTFQGVTYDPLISVAAIANTGALSSFSNYGATTVDIAAPGTTIPSTFAGKEWFTPGSYTYANASGTSMATPHVTGAAALIASEYPGLHPKDLRTAILNGRTAYATLTGIVATGGRLNIPGSIALVGPSPFITISDNQLNLSDTTATITFNFSEAVAGFSLADISLSPGHGSIADLTTPNNIVWTATFTPANVETQAARVMVGDQFASSASGNMGSAGQSALFAIDRIAPNVTVSAISATKIPTGAQVAGTLNALLGIGEQLAVYRDGVLLGNANVSGTGWQLTDAAALSSGTYTYTARAVDAAGNAGALSSQGTLVIDQLAVDFALTPGITMTNSYGYGYNGTRVKTQSGT
jgi:subtilisin family serine protease